MMVSSAARNSVLDRLANARGWVFDIDGTLMRTTKAGGEGGTAIGGAAELVAQLRAKGRRILVCTQASTRTPADYAAILTSAGFTMDEGEVITAGLGAALFLRDRYPGGNVLVLGSAGLHEPIVASGLTIVKPGDAATIDAVVVGHASVYESRALDVASKAILAGAGFFTTTDVFWFHGGLGRSLAPSGFIAAALGAVCGRKAQVLGKPSAALGAVLLNRLGLQGREVVVVDDNIDHGVRLAHAMGAMSVMPLSGASTRADVEERGGADAPSLICEDVGQLLAWLGERLETIA